MCPKINFLSPGAETKNMGVTILTESSVNMAMSISSLFNIEKLEKSMNLLVFRCGFMKVEVGDMYSLPNLRKKK